MRSARWLVLVIATLSWFGCQDDLPKASLIQHMRVLGARTEVIGDEERSTPRPGESAVLTWTVAYPEYEPDDSQLEALFITCTAPTRFTGVPVCQEIIDAASGGGGGAISLGSGFGYSCAGKSDKPVEFAGVRLTCLRDTPRLEVEIEPEFKPRAKLVQGIICRNGTPKLDLTTAVGAACTPKPGAKQSEIESIPIYGTVPIARKRAEENLNPTRDRMRLSLRVELSDTMKPELWEPTAPELMPDLERECAAQEPDGAVQARDVNRELIGIHYPAAEGDEEDEELQFSSFATFGELSRRFTILEPSDRERQAKALARGEFDISDDGPSELTWELSRDERDELVGSAKLVRFYFSVMDDRGGFDLTTRELCVTRLQ